MYVRVLLLSPVLLMCLCVSRLEDVGLEKFSVPVLFTRIFIPAAFLLVLTLMCFFSADTVTGLGLGDRLSAHSDTEPRLWVGFKGVARFPSITLNAYP